MAAIAMALMSVGVAGAAMSSYMLLRAKDAQSQAKGQVEVLNWADQAVRGFAISRGRLPCPAVVFDGPEACAETQTPEGHTGWLPVGALAAARPGTGDVKKDRRSDALGNMSVRYILHGVKPAAYASGTNLDICSNTPAFLPPTAAGSTDPAYSLAVTAPGAPTSASGDNAAPGVTQFDATSSRSTTYQDMVREVKGDDLTGGLGCEALAQALYVLNNAKVWSELNEGNRVGGSEALNKIAEITRLGIYADALALITMYGDMANGAWNAAENTLKEAEAIANPLDWMWIAVHAAGIVKATTGTFLSSLDVAATVIDLAVQTTYMEMYSAAADKLDAYVVWDAKPMATTAYSLGGMVTMPPDLTFREPPEIEVPTFIQPKALDPQ